MCLSSKYEIANTNGNCGKATNIETMRLAPFTNKTPKVNKAEAKEAFNTKYEFRYIRENT